MQTAYMTLILILTLAVLGIGILDVNTGSGHASTNIEVAARMLDSKAEFCRSCR